SLLRAFVLVLTEVHELRHRRLGLRGDLDEIEVGLFGETPGILDTDDTDLLAVRSDETNFGNADTLVDARVRADGPSLVRVSRCPELLDLVPMCHVRRPARRQPFQQSLPPEPAERSEPGHLTAAIRVGAGLHLRPPISRELVARGRVPF